MPVTHAGDGLSELLPSAGPITATSATPERSDTGQAANPDHVAAIDALRGVAALSILIYHTVLVPNPHLPVPYGTRSLFYAGGAGVQLFFVVSAFTLCLSWHARGRRAGRVVGFYVRRAFRILPLFYTMLAITLVADWYRGNPHRIKEVVANVLVLFNLVPGRASGIAPASWTIGVEVLFYWMFPLLASASRTVPRALVGTAVAVGVAWAFHVALWRSSVPAEFRADVFAYSLFLALPVFLAGFAAHAVFARGGLPRPWGPVATALGLAGAAALAYSGAFNSVAVYDWVTPAWVLLLLGLIASPNRLIVNPVTRFYGRISYSLYLCQFPVVIALIPAYRACYRLPGTVVPLLLCGGLSVVAMTPVAWLGYQIVEKPGMRLGSKLLRRRVAAREVG